MAAQVSDQVASPVSGRLSHAMVAFNSNKKPAKGGDSRRHKGKNSIKQIDGYETLSQLCDRYVISPGHLTKGSLEYFQFYAEILSRVFCPFRIKKKKLLQERLHARRTACPLSGGDARPPQCTRLKNIRMRNSCVARNNVELRSKALRRSCRLLRVTEPSARRSDRGREAGTVPAFECSSFSCRSIASVEPPKTVSAHSDYFFKQVISADHRHTFSSSEWEKQRAPNSNITRVANKTDVSGST
ncbi:hypothetical protein EVAR_86421_1 [Eumeta japonica]|uniref:Uncharacterized protein n=1 Tax=Eumeta variegata TaxID=151549 RepID=A0A4C1ZCU4_EUMVA|nr:hypothetical protein EVAR_86421_1 [Eumeta japonica]